MRAVFGDGEITSSTSHYLHPVSRTRTNTKNARSATMGELSTVVDIGLRNPCRMILVGIFLTFTYCFTGCLGSNPRILAPADMLYRQPSGSGIMYTGDGTVVSSSQSKFNKHKGKSRGYTLLETLLKQDFVINNIMNEKHASSESVMMVDTNERVLHNLESVSKKRSVENEGNSISSELSDDDTTGLQTEHESDMIFRGRIVDENNGGYKQPTEYPVGLFTNEDSLQLQNDQDSDIPVFSISSHSVENSHTVGGSADIKQSQTYSHDNGIPSIESPSDVDGTIGEENKSIGDIILLESVTGDTDTSVGYPDSYRHQLHDFDSNDAKSDSTILKYNYSLQSLIQSLIARMKTTLDGIYQGDFEPSDLRDAVVKGDNSSDTTYSWQDNIISEDDGTIGNVDNSEDFLDLLEDEDSFNFLVDHLRDVYEDQAAYAILHAVETKIVPKDLEFWMHVSKFLDSPHTYLRRAKRSTRRWRERRWRNRQARLRAMYMSRMSITYSHVVPCAHRDRYFCLNGGTCVFVKFLHIKTCRCPIGFEGVRCELIDNGFFLTMLNNQLH